MILTNYQITCSVNILSEPKENQKYNDPQRSYRVTRNGSSPIWHNKKILIIDTNLVNCEILKKLFKTKLARITVIHDPVVLLNYNQHNEPYQLIVMEIYLKGVNGIQLLKRIRNHDKNTPVVVYSVLNLPDVKEECQKVGCTKYLVKPDDLYRLISVCDSVIL